MERTAPRVRIKHRRLIDNLFLHGDGRFDREKLCVDIRHVHRRTLNGKSADIAGVYAVTVNKARYFNASVRRKVFYKSVVYNISAYLIRSVCNHCLHDS